MHGDFTRWTYRPENGYRSVLLQQGRVLLDADWNEQTEITAHHDEVRTLDIVGQSGGPAPQTGPGGFAIVDAGGDKPDGTPWSELFVTPGRYYVDGLLCESDPSPVGADPGWPLTGQPYLDLDEPPVPGGTSARYALYLDAWTHHVTADEEPALIEPALGGPDTTTRARTVWQVRAAKLGSGELCSDLHDPGWLQRTPPTMSAALQDADPGDDPCQVTALGGYQLLENQLYRVQVHAPAVGATPATFVWSRENGSVVAGLRTVTPVSGSPDQVVLGLDREGRDEELSFAAGDLVEVTSPTRQLRGEPGVLASAGAPTGRDLPVTWVDGGVTLADLGADPVVRRWEGGPLPLGAGEQALEGGILVSFAGAAQARSGDYWLIPARTVRLAYGIDARSGTIDWPRTSTGVSRQLPPHGTTHHLTPLAIVKGTDGKWTLESDCRLLFPPLTDMVSLDLVGGDGQEAMPGDPLPQPVRVVVRNGGRPVVDAPVRFTVGAGGVSLDGTGNAQQRVVRTDSAGIASTRWRLGNGATDSTTQTLRIRRLDDAAEGIGTEVVVTGRHSVAKQVQWDPACDGFAATRTVQDALTQLVTTGSISLLGGDGQQVEARGRTAPHPVRVRVDTPCGPFPTKVIATAPGKGLVAHADETQPTPTTLSGTGASDTVTAVTDADGVVALWWQPGFDGDSSDVLDVQADGVPGLIKVTAHLATTGGRTPGLHIERLQLGDEGVFLNEARLSGQRLATGFMVTIDGLVDPASVDGKPVVHVWLDLPWPIWADGGWGDDPVGTRPVELAGEVSARKNVIVWEPAASTRKWVQDQLWAILSDVPAAFRDVVRGRVVIDGWAICGADDPDLHVNGHSRAAVVRGRTLLAMPTDDEVAGGTFTQWFDLSQVVDADPDRNLIVLPDFRRMTRARVERELSELGLEWSETVEESSDEIRRNSILGTDPPPGELLEPGTPVTVRLSKGKPR